MARKKSLAIVMTLVGLAVLVLAGSPSGQAAGLIASITDDHLNNKPPYTAPLKGAIPPIPPLPVLGDPVSANDVGKSPAELGGCDTVDPVLTVNRDNVSYRCNERYDIKSATVTTTATEFVVTWTVNAPLPVPGELTDPDSAGSWMFLDVRFRTPWMNARRIVGDTLDCKRYAHAGPYLMGKKNLSTNQLTPGNNDWMSIWVEMLADDGAHFRYQHGWSHNDPGSIGNFLTVADPPIANAQGCDAAGNIITTNFGGTGGTPVGFVCPSETPGCPDAAKMQSSLVSLSADKRTLTVRVPFNFGYVDNQRHPYTVPIMQPGQVIWDVAATASALFNCAATPNVTIGTTQVIGPQGVQCALILDWAPYGSFDLGRFPTQLAYGGVAVEALLGPTCPYFQVLEYTPGQARQDKAPYYFNLGKGPQGQDNDVMLNPLYTDKANAIAPLVNYDAGWAANTTNLTSNTLVRPSQARNGNTVCNIAVPEAQRQASSPYQGTS